MHHDGRKCVCLYAKYSVSSGCTEYYATYVLGSHLIVVYACALCMRVCVVEVTEFTQSRVNLNYSFCENP